MSEFVSNNAEHANMGYTPFKLNCWYYLHVFLKEDIEPRLRSKAANNLTEKLRNLIVVYKENLQYAQKLQKQVHNKETKLKSYTPSDKI